MGNSRWTQRQHCGESSLVVVDPRAAGLCPVTNHLWVVESATRHSVERLRCVNTGVDVPLRAWEETIAAVEFSRHAPLRVYCRVRARDGTLRLEQRSTSDPRRVKRAYSMPTNGRDANEASPRANVLRERPSVFQSVRMSIKQLFGLSSRVELSELRAAADAKLVDDANLVQNEEERDRLQSGWTEIVLRDEHGYFVRAGDVVGLFDARSGTVVGVWRNVEPVAMNSRSIALLRDGHAVILSRSSLEPRSDSEDFAAARALFITDNGAVVAQDSRGTTRWWRSERSSLVCEHATTDTLVGLARGGVEAVFFGTDERTARPVLRGIVVDDAIATESRCIPLPADARSIQCFRDDLRDVIVERAVEHDELYWIRDGSVVANAVIERPQYGPDDVVPRQGVRAARCVGDTLTCIVDDRAVSIELADGLLSERGSARLWWLGIHAIADWAVFTQGVGEEQIAALVFTDRAQGKKIQLVRRSRAPATLARLAPVIAWPQLHHRTVGVQIVGEPEAETLSCLANDAADTIHCIALSPHGTWLAVALRSGKILRFERTNHATE